MTNKERARRAMDDILTWQAGVRGGYQVRTESAADIIEMALAAVERETLERAAEICMNAWRTAPNDRTSGFRQNAISHGCIAAADAIKATIQDSQVRAEGGHAQSQGPGDMPLDVRTKEGGEAERVSRTLVTPAPSDVSSKEVSPGNYAHDCPAILAGFAGLLASGKKCTLCGWVAPTPTQTDKKLKGELEDCRKAVAFWEAECKRITQLSDDIGAKHHEAFMQLYAEKEALKAAPAVNQEAVIAHLSDENVTVVREARKIEVENGRLAAEVERFIQECRHIISLGNQVGDPVHVPLRPWLEFMTFVHSRSGSRPDEKLSEDLWTARVIMLGLVEHGKEDRDPKLWHGWKGKALKFLNAGPVQLVLSCPQCTRQHVDRDEWAERLHKTHRCEHCEHEWRPFDYYTVGVDWVTSDERKDTD